MYNIPGIFEVVRLHGSSKPVPVPTKMYQVHSKSEPIRKAWQIFGAYALHHEQVREFVEACCGATKGKREQPLSTADCRSQRTAPSYRYPMLQALRLRQFDCGSSPHCGLGAFSWAGDRLVADP